MPSFSPGPLLPHPPPQESGGGGGAPPVVVDTPSAPAPPSKKAGYVGILSDGDIVARARHFGRHKIDDLPGAVVSARLELYYVDKALPTGNVALIEIADFATLAPDHWGIVERGLITATAITPATSPASTLSLDVTAAYNAAKTAGLEVFAWKLQYANETEGVGLGRWYRIGASGDVAPVLVVTTTAGQDARLELLAIPVTVDLAQPDALGDPAAVVLAGDGATYPPLGEGVRLAATVIGLTDDAAGTYTGTPSAPIVQGPDIIHFLWRSTDVGAVLRPDQVNVDAFLLARARLTEWFPLAGGCTNRLDVREWIAQIAGSCRSFAYLDQTGKETLYTEPAGGSGQPTVRLVRPWEHGPLRLFPVLGAVNAIDPVSRVEVFYALDYLGLAGWQGHALIAAGDTEPADALRDAQAAEAVARYGIRAAEGVSAADTQTGYAWVPLDQPGIPTGVRVRNHLWDSARRRPRPVQGLEVALPRWALAWRLMDEFRIESYAFPSAAARVLLTARPFSYATPDPAPLAYQARRARCSVRALPRFTAEHGPEFPVIITAQILAWETV